MVVNDWFFVAVGHCLLLFVVVVAVVAGVVICSFVRAIHLIDLFVCLFACLFVCLFVDLLCVGCL